MKKILALCCVTALIFGLAGCGSFAGWGPMGHASKVDLSSNNFTVLKSNVSGSATVSVLFPLPIPFTQFGLPLGDSDLYRLAMKNLKEKIDSGKESKENIGLVNLTVDETLKHYVWMYGWKTVTITADVVKFR